MAQQRERRLLGEWIFENHKDVAVHFNYPMGADAIDVGYREYMVKAPRCDALWIEDGKIYIVEAKVVDEFKGIAELENYKRLVPNTPSLAQYAGFPVVLMLLVAREKPDVTDLCIAKDILKVVYTPEWVKEYLAELVRNKRQR